MELMVGGGFQEEDEARAKWLRARLDLDPAVDLLHRLARDAGSSRSRRAGERPSPRVPARRSVPAQHIAGGMGETPGFDYRAHLEAVISHGTPPIKWVRRSDVRGEVTMDFGLILPSYRAGATSRVDRRASETAARLGWQSVFTTDHLLVEPSKRSEDYYTLFDALNTLAYLGRQAARR